MNDRDIEAISKTGLTVLELKLQYLQTLAAKVDDHAAYLEAAGKVMNLLPEILAALADAREASSVVPLRGSAHGLTSV
jgi:hypothetical protein